MMFITRGYAGEPFAIFLDSAPSRFVQVLLLSDCRFFQRESMTKWNSKPVTYTFALFRYLFST